MTLRIKLSHLVIGLVACAMLVGAGYALAGTRTAVIHACVNSKTRELTVPANGRCARGSKALSWNRQGPRGTRGSRGATGRNGAAGTTGAPATVTVGSVTTEAPGSQATVTNAGTASNAVLNFGIPQGAAGAAAPGPALTAYGQVWMWTKTNPQSNATSLASGSSNVTVSGGDGAAVVDVSGCSASGIAEPVITVTANHDPHDQNPGNNVSAGNNNSDPAVAYVTGWSPSGSVLEFNVSTYNPTDAAAANSDFSFAVYC